MFTLASACKTRKCDLVAPGQISELETGSVRQISMLRAYRIIYLVDICHAMVEVEGYTSGNFVVVVMQGEIRWRN